MHKLIFYIIASFLSLIIGVFLFEKIDIPSSFKNDFFREAPDLTEGEIDLRTFDLYPYSGWHIPSNFKYTGPLENEKVVYDETNIKTGDKGFFIDFSLNDPPIKKEDEFRIIIIGGSGAMGMGAQSNKDMYFKTLEKKLNKFYQGKKIIRIINLSMAGSILYQNFISLNRWGHQLKPDLIISYIGVNDIFIPLINESDSHLRFNELNGLTLLLRASEYPDSLLFFSKLFPKTFNTTGLGHSLKMLIYQNYFYKLGKEQYIKNSSGKKLDKKEIFNEIILLNTIKTFKSIKRDFEGIPIFFILQITDAQTANHYSKYLGNDYYNNFFLEVKKNISGYINNDWFFFNAHKEVEHLNQDHFSTHLSNEGQRKLSEMIYIFLKDNDIILQKKTLYHF
tara:strand:- start:986 stop:2164 length:1179 start_codon:yes stop_codon:yes gene_type:complete